MKIILKIIFILFLFISSCKKEPIYIVTPSVEVVNPYHIYEGMYIGVYNPFSSAPSYIDTMYLETLNLDSFIIRNLDSNPRKLKIDSSGFYNLGCNWTHCGRSIKIIPPDTLKYSYGYSWGTPFGSGSGWESFLGIKQ